ncbi:MAG: Bug family tripartite tricarboxylate transporter substrate binding protein [Alphaproteobacteria bacterium]
MLRRSISLAAIALAMTAGSATAADYFANKRVTLYVAASPGGGYAVYARAIARHWNKHIAGKPSFTVKHMQGAQGLVAAGYLANKSKRDGTEVLASYREAVTTTPLTSKKGVHFDPTKLTYIGSADQSVGACVAHQRTGVKTLEDAMKQPVKLGATTHRSLGYSVAYLMNNLFDTKFEVYHGYPANTAITIAVERGEVDAACSWTMDSMKVLKPTWVKGETVNILVQLSLSSYPDLKGKVPLISDFAKTQEQRDMVKLVMTPQSVGRPYVAPPEVPASTVKILRTSFLATLKDDGFLKDATKQGIEVNPVTGEELEALVKGLFATPPETVAKMLDVTTKSDRVKLVKVELPWKTDEVKIEASRRDGRSLVFKSGGEKVTVSVSGSQSDVKVAGKKAKRSAIKPGMTCKVTHQGDRTTAKAIDCQ